MTRVNVVPVNELTKEHAFGEYKEILRVFGGTKKALLKYPNKYAFYKAYGSRIPNDYTQGASVNRNYWA